MMINTDSITIVTHNGNFHTDDVFACAMLLLAHPETHVEIVRSRDQEVINAADIVFDVGGIYDPASNRFDHHQIGGAGVRENGIPFASFGLVWKHYGEMLCGNKEAADLVDVHIVSPIDAIDNGVDLMRLTTDIAPYTIGSVIGAFKASWSESDPDKINDAHFYKVVEWTKEILSREILNAKDFILAKNIVEHAYRQSIDKRIIVLDGPYPASEVLQQYPEPLYIVRPRQDGKWGVKCISIEPRSFTNRKSLPEAWAGLRDEALQAVTGVADAVFCHNNRFLAIAGSKEGALALAQHAVES